MVPEVKPEEDLVPVEELLKDEPLPEDTKKNSTSFSKSYPDGGQGGGSRSKASLE